MRFRSKVVEIEAVQFVKLDAETGLAVFDGASIGHLGFPDWLNDALTKGVEIPGAMYVRNGELVIFTIEGRMLCSPGDWVVRGLEGELYPCKPSVFQRKYEPA